ncbi:MAG: AhpC/TSA family protein [Actinomycetota bacterium]
MRILAELEAGRDRSRVLHVMEGDAEVIDGFFSARAPEARVVADSTGDLRRGLGLRRGGWWAMFGAGPWRRGVGSFLRGNAIGRPHGADGWTLPSFLVVDGGEVTWRHDGVHAGDHPDLVAVLGELDRA